MFYPRNSAEYEYNIGSIYKTNLLPLAFSDFSNLITPYKYFKLHRSVTDFTHYLGQREIFNEFHNIICIRLIYK